MKIHLAGYYNGKASAYKVDDYPYFLESYHYISDRHCDMIREDGRKIFLDSGAFSAFTQGVDIDKEEYADFIKRNHDIFEVASVLDGIGDPQLTWDNQRILEDLGVEVLPCFHYGEDTKWLEMYLEKYDHITLGGMVPISTKELHKWLDFIWGDFLTDSKGLPIVKVHGFGLTVLDLMEKYPWYSVDSTSWVLTGRFGSIYFPTPANQNAKLTISSQSPKVKHRDGHYDSMSPAHQEQIRAIIEAKGFDVNELREIYWKRDLWNIDFFKDMCDTPIKPFFPQRGIFG